VSQSGSIIHRPAKKLPWAAVYRAADPATGKPKQIWKSFKTKKEAEAYLRRQVVQVEDGVHVRPSRETLRDYVEDAWLPSLDALVAGGKLRQTTALSYSTMARLHVLPRIGGTRLTAIDAPLLNRLYADLLREGRRDGKGGLSTTTVHLVHVTISRALKDAVKWGRLARNPAQVADPPQAKNAEKQVWSADQLHAFLDFTRTERLGALWHLLATTGIRRGEAAGLTWEDVNLEAAELTIRRARVVVDYQVVESGPKTEKGRRTIALDPGTVATLRRYRAAQAEERLSWGPAYEDTGLVFTREDGSGLHPERITQGFARLVKRSGLPTLTVHGVRHSYATALADAGVPIDVISKRLGHSGISITADLYRHRTDQSDRAAAEAGALRIVGGAS
jgi:integrase